MLHQFNFDVVGSVDENMRMPFSSSTGPSKRICRGVRYRQRRIKIIAGKEVITPW